ncbi:MAG TPA: methyl-accepting chemotaxis protein, partial [Caldimonas sp.]
MSFVNKIKGWGQKGAPADSEPSDGDVAVADHFDPSDVGSQPMAPPDLALPDVDIEAAAAFDAEPGAAHLAPAGGSIISAAVPSEIADFTETRLQGADSGAAPLAASLPMIGARPVGEQQRILLALLALGLIGLIGLAMYSFFAARGGSTQVGATGQAMMQSQRLAKSVTQAIVGSTTAFPEVKESSEVLATNVRNLKGAAPAAVQESLDVVVPLVDRAEKNAGVIVAQQKSLTEVGQSLRLINRQSFDLLESAEAILSMKLQRDVNPVEVSALSQVVMLTQRIGKSANEFLTAEGVNPEAVFLLEKDLKSFNEITKGLLEGSGPMGLPGTRDPQIKERLTALVKQYQDTKNRGASILTNLPGLNAARDAQTAIVGDSEALRKGLETVQERLESESRIGAPTIILLILFAVMAAAGGYGFLRLYVTEQGQRAALAQSRRLEAEAQEQEAKRVNDANQAAILRLMNELQGVAEGDLTQQATVTEDITGAIADSVNYTVEELRTLVSQVQGTVSRVASTTEQVEANSTELLAASSEQLREIRDTGESVLQMAGRINNVSTQAQETATVARQSLHAAESGLKAVQNTIGGMNSIRDQIQETSKRIKRLGESSQEIG